MEKILTNGKIKYKYDLYEIRNHKPKEKKEIDYNHIVARSTQNGLKQLEFCKEQIARLQRQINWYNEIRKELQKQLYGN